MDTVIWKDFGSGSDQNTRIRNPEERVNEVGSETQLADVWTSVYGLMENDIKNVSVQIISS